MSKIQFIGTQVGVQRLDKSSRPTAGEMFSNAEISNNVGTLKFIGEEVKGFSVGQKVYFGQNNESVRIAGYDILVMDVKNVFAKVEDSNEEKKSENPQT